MKTTRLLITLAIAFGMIGYLVWRSSETHVAPVKLVGFQESDVPPIMPKSGEVDMRFHMISAWQANQIPNISQMSAPLGSENGALVYNAQPYWEMNNERGGHHTGDDLNGIGGQNTDLGDPVYAAADGLVIYAGEPAPGWGNIIILAHRGPNKQPLQTMYAHLEKSKVSLGALVARGEIIGTVGTANGNYLAHLHFEIRQSDGVEIGGGYLKRFLNHLDPSAVIASMHDAEAKGISTSLLKLANLSAPNPWTTLEMKGAEKFMELKN
ncbi:MAG: M23 family metallopeptidase [Verrucomicrobiota bacterium]